MAGMKVQVVEVDKDGNIDMAHLNALVRAGLCAFHWFYRIGLELLCNVVKGALSSPRMSLP